MRAIGRFLVALAIIALAAGPALAVPLPIATGLAVAAPAAPSQSPHVSPLAWLALPAAFGAIRIKDTGTLAKKFVRNASAAAGDYKDGVAQAGQDWLTNTANASDNFASGVQQAISDGRFARGVQNAGSAKFVQRASTLGAQRYPTGVGAAESEWAKNTQPALDVLKGLNLPPRRPKGDPGNQARANAVAQALRAMKVGK